MTNRFNRTDDEPYLWTRVLQFPVATNSTPELVACALKGLGLIWQQGLRYKKAGVMVTGIVLENTVQADLFDQRRRDVDRKAMLTLDEVNRKLGRDMVRLAAQGYGQNWQMKRELLSPCYTTRVSDLLVVKA